MAQPRAGAQDVTTKAPYSTSETRTVAVRLVVGGLLSGAVAGMVMAMWTMLAGATVRNFGVFTPLYLMAAPFGGVDEAQAALAAAPLDAFYWATAAGLIGAGIHMVNSMILGVVFGALARLARLRGIVAVVAGMAFGVAVMLVMDWVLAPATEAIFGGGRFVTDLPEIIGWGTWTVAHLVFGAVVGLWAALRPGDAPVTSGSLP